MKLTKETKEKISQSRKGKPAWNKGTKQENFDPKTCKLCNKIFYKNKHMNPGRWNSREFCSTKCSKINTTKLLPKECITCSVLFYKNEHTTFAQWPDRKFCSAKCALQKSQKDRIGKKLSKEWREKLSNSHIGQKAWNKGTPYEAVKGEKNPNWKGGVSEKNRSKRENHMNTLEYKAWRRAVFERDDYTCQNCKSRGGKINADHIQPYSLYPELRLAIENGRTLCVECHNLIGWKFFKERNPNKKQNQNKEAI